MVQPSHSLTSMLLIPSLSGKHASLDYSSYLLMEYNTSLALVAANMNPLIPAGEPALVFPNAFLIIFSEIRNMLFSHSVYEYVHQMVVNLPPPRLQVYLDTDIDRVNTVVTTYASEVCYVCFVSKACHSCLLIDRLQSLGFPIYQCTLPVLTELQDKNYLTIFLQLILNVVIITLMTLSILLIYSILTVSVETRARELGVLRMLGMRRVGTVHLLLVQSSLYSLPALAIGLVLASFLYGILVGTLKNTTNITIPPVLSTTAIMGAVGLAVLVPLFSALLPIYDALSKTIVESIDLRRVKVAAVVFSITRADNDFSNVLPMLIVGGTVSFLGISIYYGLPYSLVSALLFFALPDRELLTALSQLTLNLPLLFDILFGLLVAMLLGAIMLTQNVEHILERVVTNVFFFWEQPVRPFLILCVGDTAHSLL
jgi:hypothetical protein